MTLYARLWNNDPDAERTATLEDVQYGGDTPVEQANTVAKALAGAGAKDALVGIIGALRYADALILLEALPNVTWVDLTLDYRAFRLIKSEEELVYTRLAASFNDLAVAAMKEQIKPGINEREIAQIIEDDLISFTLTGRSNRVT
jgi:Xaa-Pro aminopeptidase